MRHQIWEAVVRPVAPGIHTFSLVENDLGKDKAGNPQRTIPSHRSRKYVDYFGVVPESDENSKPNRSAYLWDAGLWTACKESRQVITECLDMRYWQEKRHQLVTQRQNRTTWVEENLEECAGILAIIPAPPMQGNDENWHLLVRPYQDAIKPTFEVMCNWLRQWDREIEWRGIFDDIPFSDEWQGYTSIKNIVVEFDSSWLLNWPREYTFRDEITPRNFVYSMMRELIREHSDSFIWLVDRGEYEEGRYFEFDGGKSDVFYDCDDEYVEVDWATWFCSDNSAAHFIYDLDQLGDRDCGWRDLEDPSLPERCPGMLDPREFHVFSHIGVLRPRRLLGAPR